MSLFLLTVSRIEEEEKSIPKQNKRLVLASFSIGRSPDLLLVCGEVVINSALSLLILQRGRTSSEYFPLLSLRYSGFSCNDQVTQIRQGQVRLWTCEIRRLLEAMQSLGREGTEGGGLTSNTFSRLSKKPDCCSASICTGHFVPSFNFVVL